MKHYIGNGCAVESLSYEKTKACLVAEKAALLKNEQSEDAFFIADLGDIVAKYKKWRRLLPRVEPFYAVKCNDDYGVLKLLADLGTSFDCASKMEIDKVLNLGISPSRIIYANPCKQTSYVRHAAKRNVDLMTFDNEAELLKVKAVFPDARLVLRILPPSNFKVQCELGMKFGCHPAKAKQLLETAKELELNVVGVSFHVGSGAEEAAAFAVAVEQAHGVFQTGLDMGFPFTLLDIGGGFPGQVTAAISFEEVVDVLSPALDHYFPASSGVQIIAEPGRYFVASAFTLTANIIAKRMVARDKSNHEHLPDQVVTGDDEPAYMYYINDGVYGSFNCLLFDHATVTPSVLQDGSDMTFVSSVWGPTCDGLDCIMEDCRLPEMQIGEWIYFEDMGAYTMCAASTFNGMPRPRVFYLCHDVVWAQTYSKQTKKMDQPISKVIPFMKAGHDLFETHDQVEEVFGSPRPELICDLDPLN
ncbi:ornithine decarboxylase-like isoform X1 [Haliotis cracherodii]|uniref:ornithine decarboxylase-like isoform X1 n=1 Tax=Haliotis cracherodii TaxID=6455 RepID=UPI001EB000C3